MVGYPTREVKKIAATFNPDEEPTNFVHAYMHRANGNPIMQCGLLFITYNFLTIRLPNLVAVCTDLFVAGQETTTTTLRWSFLLLAQCPDVQRRCREEIHRVIGRERLVTQADKARLSSRTENLSGFQNQLPFISATIHECQRVANIVPFNFVLTHRTTQDTHIEVKDDRISDKSSFLQDMPIPKGTATHIDIHHIHCTDPLFVEPEKFNPSRYLCEDGITLRKDLLERTIAFGYGKRACAGEGLARLELFMALTATLQVRRETGSYKKQRKLSALPH